MELVKNLKQSKLLKYVFLALIGSIVLAVSSKIKIPFYPVPMTMQTLAVLVIGVLFVENLYRYNNLTYFRELLDHYVCWYSRKNNRFNLFYGTYNGILIGFIYSILFRFIKR